MWLNWRVAIVRYSIALDLTIGCGDLPHEIYDLVAYTRTRYAHESFDPGFPRMTPKLAEIFTNIRYFAKGGSRLGRLPPPLAVRTVVEGLIWPFGFWTHSSHLCP